MALLDILQNIIGVPATAAQTDLYYATCCAIGILIVYGVMRLFFFAGDTMSFRR